MDRSALNYSESIFGACKQMIFHDMTSESTLVPIRETDRTAIEAELNRLLAEKRFSGAPQMSAFLRYIVTQTLEGNAERIKAYSVGVDALGKPDSFDAQNDPSVRVLALRLRKTLDAIYTEGAPAHAIVDLQVGTYVPEFLKVPTEAPLVSSSFAEEARFRSDKTATTFSAAGVTGLADPVDRSSDAIQAAYSDKIPALATDAASATASDTSKSVAVADATFTSIAEGAPPLVNSSMNAGTEKSLADKLHSLNGKYILTAALLLLTAAWQLGGSHALKTQGPQSGLMLSYASLGQGSLQSLEFSPILGEAASSIPTLYLDNSLDQSEFEHQLTVLLGSSFVRAGTVNVIKRVLRSEFAEKQTGSYQLILSELTVEGQSRLETQVVSLDTGEVLMASTFTRENTENDLTETDIFSIESLATSIASKSGPVYRDYCLRHALSNSSECVSS